MSSLIESLPGMSLPVSEVTPTLASIWDSMMSERGEAMSEFRASQLNLILHFGLKTTPEEARQLFDTAVAFAQRYPCRIIVLCPQEETVGVEAMTGKLFSQCYVGPQLRELCCCEALILGYHVDDAAFLENQVSLWIETDLPVYHWFHRVPPERIATHYQNFLQQGRRVIFDAAVDPGLCEKVDWPDASRVRNLAHARTLPLRQNIGQFLSGFTPDQLTDGLIEVSLRHAHSQAADAARLMEWLQGCLADAQADASVKVETEAADLPLNSSYNLAFAYQPKKKYFAWAYREETKSACVGCNFGHGVVGQPFHIEPMSPEAALAEALFF